MYYAGEDYKLQIMTLDLWYKDSMENCIDLDFVGRQMKLDDVKWDETMA